MQDTVPELAKDLLTHVVALREMGVLALEKAPDEAVRAGTGISPAAPTTSGRETLAEVLQDLGACDRCRLARGRQNIVFGSGNPDARVLFVGEGPGKDEDESGEPFVGRAG